MAQNLDEKTLEQARMLDADTPRLLREGYEGKCIIYYNHEVIASGEDAEEALNALDTKYKSLPWIIRDISAKGNEINMGGPKSL